MKNFILILFAAILFAGQTYGQNGSRTEVLTLGSFHFNFPNRDVKKFNKSEQIDVLEAKHQKEIKLIVGKLAKFKPTVVVVERDADEQAQTDADYQNYLAGKYELKRREDEQIGFRLAKAAGVKKIYCVNDWGKDYEDVAKLLENKDSPEAKKFLDYFYDNPDSAKIFMPPNVFKTKGILAELKRINTEEYQKGDFGNYLMSVFKYETPDNKNFGADFTTGWWFNRNLRIFRNIQRLDTKPTDRIFVIFGAGHLNLLNPFFASSHEYKLLKVNDFLK